MEFMLIIKVVGSLVKGFAWFICKLAAAMVVILGFIAILISYPLLADIAGAVFGVIILLAMSLLIFMYFCEECERQRNNSRKSKS